MQKYYGKLITISVISILLIIVFSMWLTDKNKQEELDKISVYRSYVGTGITADGFPIKITVELYSKYKETNVSMAIRNYIAHYTVDQQDKLIHVLKTLPDYLLIEGKIRRIDIDNLSDQRRHLDALNQ